MQELLINTFDIACIIDSLKLGAQESSKLKKVIWDNERDFMLLEEGTDYKKWLYNIQHWIDYLYDKTSLDAEFPKIQKDIEAQGSELYEVDYLTDSFDIDFFFKRMRFRLLYLDKRGFERMKLRTLLSAYGYKRRSPYIISYLKKCLYFYHIQTYTRGNVICDIEEIALDDMVTFRVINADTRRRNIDIEDTNVMNQQEGQSEEIMLHAWKEINNIEFAVGFCDMLEKFMRQFQSLGIRKWGNGGYTMELPTFEVVTDMGDKVWCAIVEFVNDNTGNPNRRGIIATFPTIGNQSLGQTMSTMIPYEFSKRFNTLAFCDRNCFEIRNYGRVTIGRRGVSRDEFFDYLDEFHSELVCEDNDGRKYFKVYEYEGELTKASFARQTYNATKLLSELKTAMTKQ